MSKNLNTKRSGGKNWLDGAYSDEVQFAKLAHGLVKDQDMLT